MPRPTSNRTARRPPVSSRRTQSTSSIPRWIRRVLGLPSKPTVSLNGIAKEIVAIHSVADVNRWRTQDDHHSLAYRMIESPGWAKTGLYVLGHTLARVGVGGVVGWGVRKGLRTQKKAMDKKPSTAEAGTQYDDLTQLGGGGTSTTEQHLIQLTTLHSTKQWLKQDKYQPALLILQYPSVALLYRRWLTMSTLGGFVLPFLGKNKVKKHTMDRVVQYDEDEHSMVFLNPLSFFDLGPGNK